MLPLVWEDEVGSIEHLSAESKIKPVFGQVARMLFFVQDEGYSMCVVTFVATSRGGGRLWMRFRGQGGAGHAGSGLLAFGK